VCGIAGGWNREEVERGLDAIAHRGPDARGVARVGALTLGHVRLAIVDLDPRSDQPYRRARTRIAFNGEIWNHRAVRADLERAGRRFKTRGDTETLAAALNEWGGDALGRLNGMFAVAWSADGRSAMLARDKFWEIPLHYAANPPRFASERKALIAMGARATDVRDVPPGCVVELFADGRAVTSRYYDAPTRPVKIGLDEAAVELRGLLEDGARDRAMSDVPVCCLLSGGVDSTVIAWALKPHVPNLVGYVAVGDPRSRDLRCARMAAEALGMPLVEVKVPVPGAGDLRAVVRAIEMPHKAQVEIGWPCLHLARAMRSDGFKVTFSGEGSDELWASYGFAYHALAAGADWHQYRKILFMTQARKNFPRCNKAFMTAGVECRLPFLHPSVVEFALSLPRAAVQRGKRTKAVIQEAFRGLLPDEIVDRPKMAFQDGTGEKRAIAASIAGARAMYAAEYERLYGKGNRRRLI